MTRLGLLLLVICAACAKKPAAKAPTANPPTTDETAPAPDAQPKETTAPGSAAGDPCDGGEGK
jgi:hypothetical protein